MSLRYSFYKSLHKTACYISINDALQSFLNNNDDKINHYDFVEFLMQSDYGHTNRLKIKEDTTVKRLLPDDWSYDGDNVNTINYTAITLECIGNGNCLYNAISILLSGYENLHCELCLKCTQELIKNRFLYYTNDFDDYSSTDVYSYEEDILNGLKNGKYCSACNVAVLSNVLRFPIQSIYPKVSNVCVDRDFLIKFSTHNMNLLYLTKP